MNQIIIWWIELIIYPLLIIQIIRG